MEFNKDLPTWKDNLFYLYFQHKRLPFIKLNLLNLIEFRYWSVWLIFLLLFFCYWSVKITTNSKLERLQKNWFSQRLQLYKKRVMQNCSVPVSVRIKQSARHCLMWTHDINTRIAKICCQHPHIPCLKWPPFSAILIMSSQHNHIKPKKCNKLSLTTDSVAPIIKFNSWGVKPNLLSSHK
jgi:hypothetical protein